MVWAKSSLFKHLDSLGLFDVFLLGALDFTSRGRGSCSVRLERAHNPQTP